MQDKPAPPPPWREERIQFWSMDFIQAPREKVFEYLTRGEHTEKYYLGMKINNPVESGQNIWFGDSEETAPIFGRVVEIVPPEKLVHTFKFRHHSQEQESTVEFRLFDEGPNLTCLITVHHGFTSLESGTYGEICFGWSSILSQLKTLLETGKPMEFPAPEAGGS